MIGLSNIIEKRNNMDNKKYITALNAIRLVLNLTEERYILLTNNKYDISKDEKYNEQYKNVYYLDKLLINEIDLMIKEDQRANPIEILQIYSDWIARMSTVVFLNSEHYNKNKKIQEHVDLIVKKLLNMAKSTLDRMEKFAKEYQPKPEA